jgi:outer membrane protein assembly factor BamB
VNKLSLLILIFLIVNNCSLDKNEGFFNKNKSNVKKTENVKIILTKQLKVEEELNPALEIKISIGEFGKNFENNQNDMGELFFEGSIKKVGKYKFSKFDDFAHIDMQPVFYNENIIFFDNKGTIISYDENQKILWKKNIYNKSEKKIRPRLSFAKQKNILIITDNIAKYYAIDIDNGNTVWIRNNIVPFNSDIKIKDDSFYVVDYKNILRSISIKDGSELWSLKTEESLTKSNTKISIGIKGKNIYFNNSIGDITAVNLKSGQLIWQLPTQTNNISKNAFQFSNSKLVINENSILFSNNKNEFYSIDVTTGLVNWKNEINSDLQPIVIDKFIITISNKGYLYVVDKNSGNIIRINDLYKDYKIKKRNKIFSTGFLVAQNKVYLSNSDGKLIVVELNTGKILNIIKISGNKILQPYVDNNNLFLIKNGSIIKFN